MKDLWFTESIFPVMTSMYMDSSISFPSLLKKKTNLVGLRTFPQFSKKLQKVRFLTGSQWDTNASSPQKCFIYVRSKLE